MSPLVIQHIITELLGRHGCNILQFFPEVEPISPPLGSELASRLALANKMRASDAV